MMKKLCAFAGFLAVSGVAFAGTPTIDGTFDGEGVWGAPVATDPGSDGWAGVDATALYVTHDATYLYLGAACANSSWQNFGFAISTDSGTGGNTAEPWGRQIDFNYPEAPNFVLRGENNNGWRELRTWNGSDWSTGSGSDLGATESNVSSSFIEARLPLATLGIGGVQDIRVAFFVSGDNAGEHGAFDQIPNGTGNTTATSWNMSSSRNVLNDMSSPLSVPVELDLFQID
ncbi:MAG: hypothetical protein KF858_07780 [Candidatus Sumerlaeia bacterium]|nr:hypothetical protein [Candidatus Sumerlaeia bacterium]